MESGSLQLSHNPGPDAVFGEQHLCGNSIEQVAEAYRDSANKPSTYPGLVPLESMLNDTQEMALASCSGVSANTIPGFYLMGSLEADMGEEALWLRPATPTSLMDGSGGAFSPSVQWDTFSQSLYGHPPVPAWSPPMATMTGESSFTILPYSNAPTGFDRLAPQCAPFEAVADFKVLIPQYHDQWVLALGCESMIREEAQELGFKKVLLSSDSLKKSPNISPLPEMTASVHDVDGLPRPHDQQSEPVAAVLVFGTPHDWGRDLQVALDHLFADNFAAPGPANGNSRTENGTYGHSSKLYFRSLSSGRAESESLLPLGVEDFVCALQAILLKRTWQA
ncbi:hypothetical protein M0657_011964 [Pyricularia oryzae]|nr:hypothetical protein M0657_011964 [Pyricularia oryzae]